MNIYNIKNWSEKHFYINKKGNICVCIYKKKKKKLLDLNNLIKKLKIKKKLPIKICFPQIIINRIEKINFNFNLNIKKYKYKGNYQLIYPIKVNPNYYIIKSILKNKKYKTGLESGSKSELMAILINTIKPITIICNGYKDKIYIKLIYLAIKLKHKIFLVIEKIKEINILNNNKINIGIRIKLNSIETNRKKNKLQLKFGLNSSQIIEIIKKLKKKNKIKNIKLLHCHLGTQIEKIKYINEYLKEIINIYIDLYKNYKIKIKYIDIGGGLAINYSNKNKINYNIEIYTSTIIKIFKKYCKKNKIPNPNIITESGRYITAHHEILITEIINIEKKKINKIKIPIKNNKKKYKLITDLWINWIKIKKEKYNFKNKKKLDYIIKKIKKYFKNGLYNIKEKSWIEKIYNNIIIYIQKYKLEKNNNKKKDIDIYNSNKIHINFSLFKFIPDSWGIKQTFPILPINGLNKKKPEKNKILDITCDSDGIIKKYINKNKTDNFLLLQKFKNKKTKIIFFLIGAYQNILGNNHNLFGNTKTILIYLSKKKYKKINILKNENIKNILKITNINYSKIKNFIKKNKKFSDKIKNLLKKKTYLE